MFDIGFWEIVLVLVIALIVVGPEKLPGLARTAGLWIAMAQRKIAEVRSDVERELNLQELRRSVAPPEALQEMRQLADRVKSLNTEIQADVRRATLLNTDSATSMADSALPVTAPPLAPGEAPLAESAAPTPVTDSAPTSAFVTVSASAPVSAPATPPLAPSPVTPRTSPEHSSSTATTTDSPTRVDS